MYLMPSMVLTLTGGMLGFDGACGVLPIGAAARSGPADVNPRDIVQELHRLDPELYGQY